MEAGVDEAGRGSLAGPVVAAAVVWNPELSVGIPGIPGIELVRDSKKLSAGQRQRAREFILQHAVSWAVGEADAATIDSLNILNATFDAMHRAIDGIDVDIDMLLVDGDRFRPYVASDRERMVIPHACIVEGDAKYLSIAAASILAKTHRDAIMASAHATHPQYGWDRNMGYGTRVHLDAIRQLGVTPLHRRTFAPCIVEVDPHANA